MGLIRTIFNSGVGNIHRRLDPQMLLAVVLLSFALPTFQWSGDAHRAIASISARYLSQAGRYFVSEHLGGRDLEKIKKSLIDVSVYADSVEWSDELHFSHTPYRECGPFNMERDCGGNGRCIVSAIGNYTSRAWDTTLTSEARAEAIKFLVHFVGDIHNPVHVGFREDKGGNEIWLKDPADKSLHDIWDYDLVARSKYLLSDLPVENEEEVGSTPWKLSENLLHELEHKGSWKQYLLNIGPEDISTESQATELASRMASKTSQEYTCRVAYKDEENKWIASGASLKEAYFESRSTIATDLIKQAGIRLAELIDNIARNYEKKKYLDRENLSNSARAVVAPPHGNIYLTLAFDFDADELLYEEQESETETAITRGATTRQHSKKKSLSRRAKVVPKVKAKNNGVCNSNVELDVKDSMIFEGVDLEQVVMIKKWDRLLLTSRSLAKSPLVGMKLQLFTVLFNGNTEENKELEFAFDTDVFGTKRLSKELVARSIAKIRNVCLHDFPAIDSNKEVSVQRRIFHITKPFFQTRVNYQFPDPSAISFSSNDLIEKIGNNEVCVYQVGRITLFVLPETLMADSPVMKTTLYQFVDKSEPVTIFLVDERLHQGSIPLGVQAAFHLLMEGRNHQPHRLSMESLKLRRTILHELADLNTFFFGTEVDRLLKLKAIKWVKQNLEKMEDYFFPFHWSAFPIERKGSEQSNDIYFYLECVGIFYVLIAFLWLVI